VSRFEHSRLEPNTILAAFERSKLGPGLGWKIHGVGGRLFQFWASPAERMVEKCSAFDLKPTQEAASELLKKLRGDHNSSSSSNVESSIEINDLRAIFNSSLHLFSQGVYRSIISKQHEGKVVWGARLVFPTPVGLVRLGPIVFLKDCPSNITFNANHYTGIFYSNEGRKFCRANDLIPSDCSALNLPGLATQPIYVDPLLIGFFEIPNQEKILDKTFFVPGLSALQNFNISFEVIRALSKVLFLSAYSENCLRSGFVLVGNTPISVVELLSAVNIQDIFDSLIDSDQSSYTIEVPTRNFLNKGLTVGLNDTFKLRYGAEIQEGNFRTLIILTPPSAQPEKLAQAVGWLLAAVRENVSHSDNSDSFWNSTNFCILYSKGLGQYSRLMIHSPEYLRSLRTLIE